jgi:C-terminal binding protein
MPRFRVVLTDMIEDDLLPERDVFGELAEIVTVKAKSEEDLFGHIEDADGLLVYLAPVSAASISRLNQCKVIVRCGVGFDNIDHKFARTRGIPVANVPDYGTEEIAETAIGMLLALARGLHISNSRLQRKVGVWSYREAGRVHRLRGRVFGMIGLGRIGIATALRAKSFGMDVVFFDPFVSDGPHAPDTGHQASSRCGRDCADAEGIVPDQHGTRGLYRYCRDCPGDCLGAVIRGGD